MSDSVRSPSPSDQNWINLATELTPAKSLARIDTVTARAVTTITIVGVLLTGLGALSAGLPTQSEPARALAVAAVITATLAVASGLAAQVLTITHRLNAANLIEVKAWYRRQFATRAYPTQAATLLLLLAVLLAGAAATAALLTTPNSPRTIKVSQTLGPGGPRSTATASERRTTVHVKVTFYGLAPGQVTTVTITTNPGTTAVLARAAAAAAPDGTAITRLTVGNIIAAQPVTVTARTPHQSCQATLTPTRSQPALSCHTS